MANYINYDDMDDDDINPYDLPSADSPPPKKKRVPLCMTCVKHRPYEIHLFHVGHDDRRHHPKAFICHVCGQHFVSQHWLERHQNKRCQRKKRTKEEEEEEENANKKAGVDPELICLDDSDEDMVDTVQIKEGVTVKLPSGAEITKISPPKMGPSEPHQSVHSVPLKSALTEAANVQSDSKIISPSPIHAKESFTGFTAVEKDATMTANVQNDKMTDSNIISPPSIHSKSTHYTAVEKSADIGKNAISPKSTPVTPEMNLNCSSREQFQSDQQTPVTNSKTAKLDERSIIMKESHLPAISYQQSFKASVNVSSAFHSTSEKEFENESLIDPFSGDIKNEKGASESVLKVNQESLNKKEESQRKELSNSGVLKPDKEVEENSTFLEVEIKIEQQDSVSSNNSSHLDSSMHETPSTTPLKTTKNNVFCDICFKAFRDEGRLMLHMKGDHDTSIEYRCVHCPKKFPFLSKLLSHYKLEHMPGKFKKDENTPIKKELEEDASLKKEN